MFLTFDGVFPQGASEQDLLAIYRPRPGLPFTTDDARRRLEADPLDDVHARADRHRRAAIRKAARYLDDILQILAANGVRMIRLDAVGYAIKKAGQQLFMMPETFEFIRGFSERAKRARPRGARRDSLVLPAADRDRAARRLGLRLRAAAARVACAFQSAARRALKRWIQIRPTNALTVLDTHDGIGVIDIGADAQDRIGTPRPRARERARAARRGRSMPTATVRACGRPARPRPTSTCIR